MDNKFWIVHGGSDSYFAARGASDAWKVVQEMSNIAMEYEMYPTSKVEVVDNRNKDDIELHSVELKRRDKEGDEFYFMP
ncbi:hypothetical protein NVP1287O_24 [Vibrio phage 1.287.O._10N.286.55.C7]|nr:hypothetical protein NVP1287O_24 [Vibrio phage 1.287.O._10N.286.55.C7]AUS01667.1 hypothetical protein NVP1289A_23 [Vibrio phage 1.289.A._10N.286.55.E8]